MSGYERSVTFNCSLVLDGSKEVSNSYFKCSAVDQVSENKSVYPYGSRQACVVSQVFIILLLSQRSCQGL